MTGDLKAEEFCTVEGLEAPLRQTFILVDDNMVNKTEDPREFVALNANVRDVVLAVADPQKALASGVTEARERVSILCCRQMAVRRSGPSVAVFPACRLMKWRRRSRRAPRSAISSPVGHPRKSRTASTTSA